MKSWKYLCKCFWVDFVLGHFSQFGSATQDDLWHHLSRRAASDRSLPPLYSVKAIMDSWTLQAGFPVVTVRVDRENNRATLTQVFG